MAHDVAVQVGAHTSGQWRDKWWEDAYAQSVSTITGAEVLICRQHVSHYHPIQV